MTLNDFVCIVIADEFPENLISIFWAGFALCTFVGFLKTSTCKYPKSGKPLSGGAVLFVFEHALGEFC